MKNRIWNPEYRCIERGDPRKYENMGRWVRHGKTQSSQNRGPLRMKLMAVKAT